MARRAATANGKPGARHDGGVGMPIDPSGGRPEYSDVYRRIVDEAVNAHGLGPGFAEAVERHFLEAPAAVCSAAIGRWILRRLREAGRSHEDLAAAVGVDRSAVTRWVQGGSITVKNLVMVLIELGGQLSDLPLPGRRELAVEAYLAAVSHTRRELDRRRPAVGGAGAAPDARPLDRERFWCLYHLLAEPHWERAVRRKDRHGIEREAGRILRRAADSLGHEPREVRDYRDLTRLVADWMEAWVVCLAHLVPRNWPIR